MIEDFGIFFNSKDVENVVKKLREVCKRIKDRVYPDFIALSLSEEAEFFNLIHELVEKLPNNVRNELSIVLPTIEKGVVISKVVPLKDLENELRKSTYAMYIFVNVMAQDVEIPSVTNFEVKQNHRNFRPVKPMIINAGYGHTVGSEEALWYCFPYIEWVNKYAISQGVETIYTPCEKSVRRNIWFLLDADRPNVVIGNGHGNESTFTTFKLDKVFWIDMTSEDFDKEWVKDVDFLMLSCLTGAKLGPYMVYKLGARSYLGWKKEFTFITRRGYRWVSDDWRKSPEVIYLKPVAEAFAKVASGEWTTSDAYNYIAPTWRKYLQDPNIPTFYKQWIKWNLDNMVLIKKEETLMTNGANVKESLEKEKKLHLIVKLVQDEKTWELLNKVYEKTGEYVEKLKIPEDAKVGNAELILDLVGYDVKKIPIKLIKKEQGEKEVKYVLDVEYPRKDTELEIGKEFELRFKIIEKVIEKPKYVPVVVKYSVKEVVSVLQARELGRSVDSSLPINFHERDDWKCKYMLGTVPILYQACTCISNHHVHGSL